MKCLKGGAGFLHNGGADADYHKKKVVRDGKTRRDGVENLLIMEVSSKI